MNKINKKISLAKKKWKDLEDNTDPIIYVGAASCGRAAGALELLAGIDEFLAENKVAARVIQVGCIGPCYLEPLVDIKIPGQPRVSYNNVNMKIASCNSQIPFASGCSSRETCPGVILVMNLFMTSQGFSIFPCLNRRLGLFSVTVVLWTQKTSISILLWMVTGV